MRLKKSLLEAAKRILIALFFTGVSSATLKAQKTMEEWESLLDKKELADYFSGMFNKLGIVVNETSERFTVIHQGDHFELREGINEEEVDYVVNLGLNNIADMRAHGADDIIDESESFKIMATLFTPLTQASLQIPTLSRPFLRKISGVENHIHVHLISPNKTDTVSHTLIYLNKDWIVIPGVHGDAKRIFHLSASEAIDYQRKVFDAMQKDSMKGWRKFRKWYLNWRKGVSIDCD
ncbi:MAG: hypothetical protein R3277_12110 [Brumimicrobium sp.]|nr:hypothetical protein [Brumimicrobium sp.]